MLNLWLVFLKYFLLGFNRVVNVNTKQHHTHVYDIYPLNEETWERISKSWLPKRTLWVTTSHFGQFDNILDFFKVVISGVLVLLDLIEPASTIDAGPAPFHGDEFLISRKKLN